MVAMGGAGRSARQTPQIRAVGARLAHRLAGAAHVVEVAQRLVQRQAIDGGRDLPPEEGHEALGGGARLAQVGAQALDGAVVVGDQLVLGSVQLTVRELDEQDKISKVGVKLLDQGES